MNAYYSNQVYDHDKYFPAKSGYNINLLPISPFYGSFEDVIRVKILSEGKSSRAVQSKFPSTNSNITQQNRIPITLLRRALHSFPERLEPVMDAGIVFYTYYPNHCDSSKRYLQQAEYNAKVFKEMDPETKIAIVTNCPVPASMYPFIDIIYPIDESDVPDIKKKQWYTRVLYNAYPPFRLNFILDTHVFPCDPHAVRDLFHRFNNSDVDISISNREIGYFKLSGGGILSRNTYRSFRFWKASYLYMRAIRQPDDQAILVQTRFLFHYLHLIHFRWLSSDWFFASNGISEYGYFKGSARCYRSSVVVNGRVRFIHGSLSDCPLMNGPNGEIVNRSRIYYMQGTCNCTKTKSRALFSSEELKRHVCGLPIPNFQWEKFSTYPSEDLYWPRRGI